MPGPLLHRKGSMPAFILFVYLNNPTPLRHMQQIPTLSTSYTPCHARSLTSDPKIGDHWAAWLRFELQFGNPDTQAAVTSQVYNTLCCVLA